jgi:uncharacterized protein YeaO (DUF488 family)
MTLRTYQYGHRGRLDGLAIGVAREVPRGVRKADYATRGYFDVWLPLLAPSRELFTSYRRGEIPFKTFAREYRAQMRSPEAKQVIRLITAISRMQPVNLGCFCEDESQCHRSVLKELIIVAASELPSAEPPAGSILASPPCFMPEIET